MRQLIVALNDADNNTDCDNNNNNADSVRNFYDAATVDPNYAGRHDRLLLLLLINLMIVFRAVFDEETDDEGNVENSNKR